MRLSLNRLRRRAADAADEVAGGTAVPAGAEPAAEERRRKRPTARERGAMRRRARNLRRRREAMLFELGALLFEMHRRDRREPELLERKAEEIRALDEEERGLREALGAGRGTVEIVAAGIAGTCPSCDLLVSTDARFCERCGTPLNRPAGRAERGPTDAPADAKPAAGDADAPADAKPAPGDTDAAADAKPAPGDAATAELPAPGDEQRPSLGRPSVRNR